MPHITVEWTDNLADAVDITALMTLIADNFRNSGGMFPLGGIRVRGIRLSDYVIADGAPDNAFIHITAKIGAGRSADALQSFFSRLFDAVVALLGDLFDRRGLALSLYVEEADEAGSFKHNSIHHRLQKGA